MNRILAKIIIAVSRKEWFPTRLKKWPRWAKLYNSAVRVAE